MFNLLTVLDEVKHLWTRPDYVNYKKCSFDNVDNEIMDNEKNIPHWMTLLSHSLLSPCSYVTSARTRACVCVCASEFSSQYAKISSLIGVELAYIEKLYALSAFQFIWFQINL